MDEIIIRKATKEDAAFLSRVVTEAIGNELCVGLAGSVDRLPKVKDLFIVLAADENSQYSFTNAFVATDCAGVPVGGIISYDGARLKFLRRAFAREASRILGWSVTEEEADGWDDEAETGEIYIDSLFVEPAYRGRAIASRLLEAVDKEYENSSKPLGLLVEPENHDAMQVYRHWGFTRVGISNFFTTPMYHLQRRGKNYSERK